MKEKKELNNGDREYKERKAVKSIRGRRNVIN